MEFQIDPNNSKPIYRQMCDQFREALARGRVEAGARMPSVRDLSRRLVVNPNTIARVYRELEHEGLLRPRQGVGVFVAEPKAELTKTARRQRLTELIDRLLTDAVHLGFAREEVLDLVTAKARDFQW